MLQHKYKIISSRGEDMAYERLDLQKGRCHKRIKKDEIRSGTYTGSNKRCQRICAYDMHGSEIYNGDNLLYTNNVGYSTVLTVVYDNASLGYRGEYEPGKTKDLDRHSSVEWIGDMPKYRKLEIIGNIYKDALSS